MVNKMDRKKEWEEEESLKEREPQRYFTPIVRQGEPKRCLMNGAAGGVR